MHLLDAERDLSIVGDREHTKFGISNFDGVRGTYVDYARFSVQRAIRR